MTGWRVLIAVLAASTVVLDAWILLRMARWARLPFRRYAVPWTALLAFPVAGLLVGGRLLVAAAAEPGAWVLPVAVGALVVLGWSVFGLEVHEHDLAQAGLYDAGCALVGRRRADGALWRARRVVDLGFVMAATDDPRDGHERWVESVRSPDLTGWQRRRQDRLLRRHAHWLRRLASRFEPGQPWVVPRRRGR